MFLLQAVFSDGLLFCLFSKIFLFLLDEAMYSQYDFDGMLDFQFFEKKIDI